MQYNWQQQDWRNFVYDLVEIDDLLFRFAENVGHVSGVLKALQNALQIEATVNLMVEEAIKTSEIEGAFFSRADVYSSITNNLGLNNTKETVKNKHADGIGELMTVVQATFAEPLTISFTGGIKYYCAATKK